MKAGDFLPEMCSRADLMVIFDCSANTISSYSTKGLLVPVPGKSRKFQTIPTLHSIIGHLREVASSQATTTGNSLQNERAETEKIARQIKEIQLSNMRGETLTVAEVTESWSEFASIVKMKVLGLPTNIRTLMPHLTNHDGKQIKDVCRDMLNELAEEAEALGDYSDPDKLDE